MLRTDDTTIDSPATTAARVTTHYVEYDAPGRRLARALCGALADRTREHRNDPTCPECHDLKARLEELVF